MRARVPSGQSAGLNHLLHVFWQCEQAQQIGNMAAAARQSFGNLFLGMAKSVHQLAIGQRFFDRIQLGALDVLNNRDLKYF